MTNPRPRHRARRLAHWINLLVFLAAVLAICASVTFIAHQERYAIKIDATKTRAYSLSPQTRTLLDRLEGKWTISIVLVEANVERPVLRQIEEVLDRYRETMAEIEVERIDPTDPASLAQYEALIQRLRDLYAPAIEEYESRLREARQVFEGALHYAGNEAAALAPLIAQVGPEGGLGGELTEVRNGFALIAQNGPQILATVDAALATDESRPLPDYEAARDTLHAGASQAAAYLAEVASVYTRRMGAAGVPEAVRAHLATQARAHQSLAAALMAATDPLVHLRPLDLTKIAQELARGEAAVITGNNRAAVIPAWQLVPKSNVRETREGGIAFDQRFRGEQVLSSTIRSMIVERMPMVVFVHSAADSLLRETRDRRDLLGAARILESSRYVVREWRPEQVERPAPALEQEVIWVIVPPAPGERGGNPAVKSREELLLIERARLLVAEGEPVLLSMYPSVLHNLRQPDPWQDIVSEFGIEPDTARVAFTAMSGPEGRRIGQPLADVLDGSDEHPIGAAIDGQLLRLPLPVPIAVDEDVAGVQSWRVIALEPGADRWVEEEWLNAMIGAQTEGEQVAAEGRSLETAQPLVVAAERANPLGEGGGQRVIVVGSGSWMQSALADMVYGLGGERIALQFPGNYELLQASVAWLAGMDELIAPSPTSQQVERLEGLSERDRAVWRWIAMAGLPGGALAVGILVWIVRRR